MPIHYAQELLLRLLCKPFPHYLDSGTEKIEHIHFAAHVNFVVIIYIKVFVCRFPTHVVNM